MLRKILLTTGLILLWALAVTAAALAEAAWFGRPAVERGVFASIENHLTQKLGEAAQNKRFGAAALVLIKNGEIAAEHAFGIADPETQAPVKTDQTLFQLASVSKAVTAFGVMKLVEEGRIGLDEPVLRYLKRWRFPGSEAYRDRVTVRHLLSHTAGLNDGAAFGVILPGEQMPTLEESLDRAAGEHALKVIVEPGTGMVYGNGNYAVLQLLIEDVTSRPFADYMKETVLQPLGMTRSSFDPDAVAPNLAADFDSRLSPQPRRRFTATGAVALYAAPQDLARFAQALTRENPVLKRETIELMLTPQAGTGGTWGLGPTLFVEMEAGGHIVGHSGGSLPAWGAMMRVNPTTGNAMILTVSGGSGALNQLPHDWVYWETGKMPDEGKRQFFYDRIKGSGLAVMILGAVAIVMLRLFGSKLRRNGKMTELKKLLIILGLTASCLFATSEAKAQNGEAWRVLNAALQTLGGEAEIKAFDSIYVGAKGVEHRSADAQGYAPEKETRAAHEEKLAVFTDGRRLAYEYKTGRHDGSTRWRRIFFTDTRRIVADFTTKSAFASPVKFPSADRNGDARRIPQTFLLEVLANRETLQYRGTRNFENSEHEVISVELPAAKTPVLLYFDKKTNLLTKYEYATDFPSLGETTAEYLFENYRKHSRLRWFPAKQTIRLGGKIWRTMDVTEVSVASPQAAAMLELPAELEGFITPAGTVKEIAKGVFLVFGVGGSYQPMFIEFRDFVMAIEAPALHPSLEETPVETLADPDSLSAEFIARIKQTVKNKPIKYVVPTHFHSDHAGGIRAFAAENSTVLTTAGNKAFFERFAPALKIETFDKKQVISDGERTVELIDVGANPHTEENIVVYLPPEKYLFQGDLFYFNGEATFPAKDRMNVMPFFAGWLRKNNLSPTRIYGFHSPLFATMEHVAKVLEISARSKK